LDLIFKGHFDSKITDTYNGSAHLIGVQGWSLYSKEINEKKLLKIIIIGKSISW